MFLDLLDIVFKNGSSVEFFGSVPVSSVLGLPLLESGGGLVLDGEDDSGGEDGQDADCNESFVHR